MTACTAPRHAGQADPPRCAAGDWCRAATINPDTNQLIPARATTTFCHADTLHIAAKLAALPAKWVYLRAELGHLTTLHGPNRSDPAKIPLRLDIDALMRAITWTLLAWEERTRNAARLTALDTLTSQRRDPALATRDAARLLCAHLETLLTLPPEPMITHRGDLPQITDDCDGASAGHDILRLHHRARTVLGETAPRPQELLGVPCPRCSHLALARTWTAQEDVWSQCGNCGHLMTEPVYRQYTKWAAGRFDTGQAVTVP